jgi:curved DNA-binding protein CbpA
MDKVSVKKAYQKACLLIHPDRVPADAPHRNLAQEVFIRLSAAYKIFEEDEGR